MNLGYVLCSQVIAHQYKVTRPDFNQYVLNKENIFLDIVNKHPKSESYKFIKDNEPKWLN